MDTDELDRLFLTLVQAVRAGRPEYLSRPFDVAELVAFVPYRSARTDVGTATNDDYAHLMMRLLSGERGYIFADELLQDDLKAELASPNPNLAAFRSYLNARVTLSQEHTRRLLESMPPSVVEHAATAETDAPAEPPTAGRPMAPLAAAGPAIVPLGARPASASAASVSRRPSRPGCKYCGQPLPEGRDVQYWPHCGQNLLVRRCGACSAELEPGWKFCVTCGRAAAP